jgi:peroxiredoxin
MKFTLLLAIAVVLAIAGDPNDRFHRPTGSPVSSRTGTTLLGGPLEIPATEVRLGDRAPDFSYQGVDGSWRHLRDILEQGPTLLVFGADELTLRVIEHERERLLDLGVVPVAVTDLRSGAARALVRRYDLRFTVLSDRRGVVAAQFNAIDPGSGRQLPTWFVLDPKRRVRGLGRRRLPLRGYPALAANALGLPAPGAALPASK